MAVGRCYLFSPSGDAAPRIFTPVYYDRLREVEATHWWYRGMRALAARWLDAEVGGRLGLRVLDLGCGAGYTLHWLRRYAAPNAITGIDLDASALRHARDQAACRLALASALALPFAMGSVDLVHCADVLQHLPTGGDAAALSECHRVLTRSGLLLLRTNAAGSQADAVVGEHYQRYTLAHLRERVEAAGFGVRRATHVNVLPSVAATLQNRLRRSGDHGNERQHGPGLPQLPRLAWLNETLSGVLAVEAAILSVPGVASAVGQSLLILAERQ